MRRLMTVALALLAMQGLTIERSAHAAGMGAHQSVKGTVKDLSGRPLADVEVLLQTEDGRIIGRTRSDKAGTFGFGKVAPGTYAVVVNKAGFRTGASIVAVTPNGAKPLEITMAEEQALSMAVVARRVAIARNSIGGESGGIS